MLVFRVHSLEFLLTLYSIPSTLVLNKEKIGGESYLNKSLNVDNYYNKAKRTHWLWLPKLPMSLLLDYSHHRMFSLKKEREPNFLVVIRGLYNTYETFTGLDTPSFSAWRRSHWCHSLAFPHSGNLYNRGVLTSALMLNPFVNINVPCSWVKVSDMGRNGFQVPTDHV